MMQRFQLKSIVNERVVKLRNHVVSTELVVGCQSHHIFSSGKGSLSPACRDFLRRRA
jgi:hypothetical protein